MRTLVHNVTLGTLDLALLTKPTFDRAAWVQQGNDEKALDIVREAQILLTLRHPNIVTFYGLMQNPRERSLSFVLGWAHNGSLYEYIDHATPLGRVEGRRILYEIASAMAYLHANNVVHRDLKSPNVLLDSTLSAKVSDFDASTLQRSDNSSVSQNRMTYFWASPEQLQGERRIKADTDVFSFGVIMWEVFFNAHPEAYYGNCGSVVLHARYKARDFLPAKEFNQRSLSASEADLLDKCFQRSGSRTGFARLQETLKEHAEAAAAQREVNQRLQRELLLGREDEVWKHPAHMLALREHALQLDARPAIKIAPLDLHNEAHRQYIQKVRWVGKWGEGRGDWKH